MSNSEKKYEAEVNVVSRTGPIRIELFDHKFKSLAIGFGELHQRVQEGLYTLRYTAGTAQREERISVDPSETLSPIRVDLPFQSSAPIIGSSTTHEFHHYPASELSRQPNKKLGTGGCVMIFVRTIDGDGRTPVSLDSLSLLDSQLRRILNLDDQPAQNPAEGWAGQCIQLNPGGYALQWKSAEAESKKSEADEALLINQSLWVAKGWVTIVFLGYNSARGQLERQSASIHMVRQDMGFNDYEPQINQALELSLGGLRTGNLIVPDDLLNLLLNGKFQNPMLGIVGAHAMLQRHQKNWSLFDIVLDNLEKLIPGDPDVIALKLLGRHLRNDTSRTSIQSLCWPPMLYIGYRALIAHDWIENDIIKDGSIAEISAAGLLPESPWTCWLARETSSAVFFDGMPRTTTQIRSVQSLLHGIAKKLASPDSFDFQKRPVLSDMATQRVIRYISDLKNMGEVVELEKLSLHDFRQIGLPVASVKKAIRTLHASLRRRKDPIVNEEKGEDEGRRLRLDL
ncbi:MAG: hypothetical protein HZB37_11915 [Planctomycetes bacterium]|nr:hypothetical protein [Planctomycetota bacterium]